MTAIDHLEQCKEYAVTLDIERQIAAHGESYTDRLAADQGQAMRQTIYHATAAIVEALERVASGPVEDRDHPLRRS